MKTCAVCGFHHSDLDTVCARCNALLDAERGPELDDFFAKRARRRLMPSLGRFGPLVLLGRVRLALRAVGLKLAVPLPHDVTDRNPWKAGFLSLIPGWGQLYNHQPKKALYLFCGWLAVFAAWAATFYQPYNVWIGRLAILWMAFAFHDGVKTAILINGQFWTTRLSLATFMAWIFEIGLFFMLAQFVSSMLFVKFRHMSEDIMAPFFRQGDRIAVEIVSYKFRNPRVGEIVFYNPKGFSMWLGMNKYIVDPKNGFERIVAGPGETFEQRAGRFYRNGSEVTPAQGPLVPLAVPWDFKLTAPADHYIVLLSTIPYEDLLFGKIKAPQLRHAQTREHWDEACYVHEDEIYGRAWFIYRPPPRRRFLRRPLTAATVNESSK